MTCSTINYRLGNVSEWVDQGDLIKKHWKEVFEDIFESPTIPNTEFYKALERAGATFVLIGETEEKKVAYAGGTIMYSPQISTKRIATVEYLYIEPEYRSAFPEFMAYVEDHLTNKERVDYIQHQTGNNPALIKYLERQNFQPIDVILMKRTK